MKQKESEAIGLLSKTYIVAVEGGSWMLHCSGWEEPAQRMIQAEICMGEVLSWGCIQYSAQLKVDQSKPCILTSQ